MERIKPIDLERTRIRRVFRGYDRNMVDLLLGRSARTIEELLSEESRLKSENEKFKAELQQYRALESTMRDALLTAQRAADETRALAHKEAEALVERAKADAKQEQADKAADIRRLTEEVENLEREKRAYIGRLRSLVEHQLREIKLLEEPTPREAAPTHAVVAEEAGEEAAVN